MAGLHSRFVGGGDALGSFDAVFDNFRDLRGSFAAHLRKVSHLLSDHSKAAPMFTSSFGLDRGVERKEFGLKNDLVNDRGLVSNLIDLDLTDVQSYPIVEVDDAIENASKKGGLSFNVLLNED